MFQSCPTNLDVDTLRARVAQTYTAVARDPGGNFHFHRGIDHACYRLRYDRSALVTLPRRATAPFAGVANPHRIGRIEPGAVVLDIGCGAGMDLLLAARRVGPRGRAIGVDMTAAMRREARRAATEAGLEDAVEVREGLAESLPVDDASVDVVISNGVLNLTPDKKQAFSEIARVLRPGGQLHLGDVTIQGTFGESTRNDIDLWAA